MTTYKVPVRCNVNGQPRLANEPDAGWTVVSFRTETDARNFMWRYSHAAMPCWQRPLEVFRSEA